jgi:hypothetical protein
VESGKRAGVPGRAVIYRFAEPLRETVGGKRD